MLLRLDVEERDDHTIVVAAGEIDAGTVEQLSRAVTAAFERGVGDVLLDFAHVTFIDSSGLGVLVRSHRDGEQRGVRFSVVHPSPHTRKLIKVLGLDQLLAIYDSPEEAITAGR